MSSIIRFVQSNLLLTCVYLDEDGHLQKGGRLLSKVLKSARSQLPGFVVSEFIKRSDGMVLPDQKYHDISFTYTVDFSTESVRVESENVNGMMSFRSFLKVTNQ